MRRAPWWVSVAGGGVSGCALLSRWMGVDWGVNWAAEEGREVGWRVGLLLVRAYLLCDLERAEVMCFSCCCCARRGTGHGM